MNQHSRHEYDRKVDEYLRILLCLVLFMSLASLLQAQGDAENYRGSWHIESPDEGSLVLIVKRNGLASYFWSDNSDLTVYQGTWSSDASGVLLQWQDGSTHRISRKTSGYTVTYSNESHTESYTTTAKQLPEDLLGQWAKAPSRPDEQISDRDQAKGFFGNWKISLGTDSYYVIIEDDRSAASNRIQETPNPNGLRGSWAKQGSELHIAWDSGHYGILRKNERNFSFKLIAPGAIIKNEPSEEHSATRIDSEVLPQAWYANYTVEREASNRELTLIEPQKAHSFYRGTWIVQRMPDVFERVEVGWFGGLKTSIDPTLQGTWRMNQQDIFMRWDDGMRKMLRPVGQGFLLYEYKPGRPLDGVPTRIFSATPQNAQKLAESTKGPKTTAKNLLHLAESSGIIASNAKATGWGQGLIHWAWPFDNTEPSQSAEPLFQSNIDPSNRIDPWWWPFWSEIPDDSDESKNVNSTDESVKPLHETTPEMSQSKVENSEAAQTDANQTTDKAETLKTVKANWEWPF